MVPVPLDEVARARARARANRRTLASADKRAANPADDAAHDGALRFTMVVVIRVVGAVIPTVVIVPREARGRVRQDHEYYREK